MEEKIIQIEELAKEFPSPDGRGVVSALQDVTLSIVAGEIYGIIGSSGAGKSTLIRILTGLDKPTSGRVLVRDTHLGMVFQHFNLFSSRTALQNILFPLEVQKKEGEKRARELLALVGLGSKGDLYPSQLSGGEKQRVAIARALATRPQILLCDEATSALDPETTSSILRLLVELNEKLGLTIILITHEMEVIKSTCNRVAVLEGGKIVEEGLVADLFAAPKHPTTMRFLQGMIHEQPQSLPLRGRLLRLCFRHETAKEPIISQIIRTTQVDINILSGSIDVLKEETVGALIVELTGHEHDIERAQQMLKEKGVIYEQL
ncbi:MAG: methionine ABC transporter ATP-binding protein [Chlamydiales bacterium]